MRKDKIGYDEYDKAVVVAESPQDAVEQLKERYTEETWGGFHHLVVNEIQPAGSCIILASFHAG